MVESNNQSPDKLSKIMKEHGLDIVVGLVVLLAVGSGVMFLNQPQDTKQSSIRVVQSEEKVLGVSDKGKEKGGEDKEESETEEVSGSDFVNINTASQSELESLPGVGPKTAEKIIDYRDSYGDFVSEEEIMEVKGIGEGKFSDIEDLITVD